MSWFSHLFSKKITIFFIPEPKTNPQNCFAVWGCPRRRVFRARPAFLFLYDENITASRFRFKYLANTILIISPKQTVILVGNLKIRLKLNWVNFIRIDVIVFFILKREILTKFKLYIFSNCFIRWMNRLCFFYSCIDYGFQLQF